MKNIALIFLLVIPLFCMAQENPGCYVQKDFLLIQSTKDYNAALKTAQEAANAFAIKLDLRDLIPDKDRSVGLTLPIDTCLKYSMEEEGVVDSTCYMARGRWDDGIYISIEYSNAYNGFSKGYYIVMVGNADKKDPTLIATLKKLKSKYADAYIKTSTVYLCCMH